MAIARAAISHPPVLILDEATSSIDTRTERLIEKGMDRLMEKMEYDGLELQKQQHRLFVQRLDEFAEQISQLSLGTQDAMIQEVFEYLQKWLHDHIKIEDMKYARFATEKTKGNH